MIYVLMEGCTRINVQEQGRGAGGAGDSEKTERRMGEEFDLKRGRHWRDHQIKWENRQWRGTTKITQRLSGEWRRSAPPGTVTGNPRRAVVLSE